MNIGPNPVSLYLDATLFLKRRLYRSAAFLSVRLSVQGRRMVGQCKREAASRRRITNCRMRRAREGRIQSEYNMSIEERPAKGFTMAHYLFIIIIIIIVFVVVGRIENSGTEIRRSFRICRFLPSRV